jgi:small-conductance mechanosensitive channel
VKLRSKLCRRKWLWLLAMGILAAGVGRAQTEDDRISVLQEQIQALNRVVAAAKNADEKGRLESKLQRMRQEVAVLKERQMIELQEQVLQRARTLSPFDALREELRTVDVTEDEAEARVHDLSAQRRQISGRRDALVSQETALRMENNSDTGRLSQIEEQIFTQNEQLRALALQSEAAESESDLAHDTVQLREDLKSAEANPRPNLRILFEAYTKVRAQRNGGEPLSAQAADLGQNLKLGQSTLELEQQKLAKFDEELAVLEKQTSFFHRDPKVEQFLAAQQTQKQALLERLPFVAEQITAIKLAQDSVRLRQRLSALDANLRQDQLAALKAAYLLRLRWPAAALGCLAAIYLTLIHAVLPLRYKNEGLFLARRLGHYLAALIAALIVAGFLFDDLSMVAATLGVVSAGLVISLQDVCTSVFAWFVIMSGGKFRIGDRLEIDGTRGDVLDIQLLRTTLLEVNGWLAADQPTGRVILVPNNVIFKTKIFNYSYGHSYIWSKLDLTVTFNSPMAQTAALFHQMLTEETKTVMAEAHQASAVMLRRYGIEDAVYEPKIYTTIADSGVVFALFFVTHYREAGAMRNKLSRRILDLLELHPEIQLAYPTLSVLGSAGIPPQPPAMRR